MKRHARANYARRTYRLKRRSFIRRNWAALSIGAVVISGLELFFSLFADGYVLGLVQGGSIAGAVAGVHLVQIAITGSMGQLSGAWGEENTRDILKWAKHRRLIYGWVDNLELQGGDVDHLVATPAGWLAIDSKWHGMTLDSSGIARDAASATRAARRASLILRSLKRSEPVTPLVVLWGAAQGDVPGGRATAFDVDFLAGMQLKKYLWQRRPMVISAPDARLVLRELKAFQLRVVPPCGEESRYVKSRTTADST